MPKKVAPLSELAVRSAKATDKVRKLFDGGGLELWLWPTGAKAWRFSYSYQGRRSTITFGQYPALSLRDARAKRDEARRLLAAGTNPIAIAALTAKIAAMDAVSAAAESKEAELAHTFGAVADALILKKRLEGKAAATLEKNDWLLALCRPKLGAKAIADITPPEVLAVLKDVEGRGKLESAKKLQGFVGEVFRFGIANAKCAADPSAALKGALIMPTVRHYPAITEPKPLGALMRAVDSYPPTVVRSALQLLALLAPRPSELRLALWSEFQLDGDAPTWEIPADRTKTRRPLAVPLPRQAVKILRDLREATAAGAVVFPTPRDRKRPLSDMAFNAALAAINYPPSVHTCHGFRATFSTRLHESGEWQSEWIEHQLGHADGNQIRRIYARMAYWEQRKAMLQAWADTLDELRAGT